MENKNTNFTPRMTTHERVNANVLNLAFGNPAVNHNHLKAEMRKLKEMDFKGKMNKKEK